MNYRFTILSILLDLFPFLPLAVFVPLCFIAFPGRSDGPPIADMSAVDTSLDAFFREVTP